MSHEFLLMDLNIKSDLNKRVKIEKSKKNQVDINLKYPIKKKKSF